MSTNNTIDLRVHTKKFALRVLRLYAALPDTVEAQILGKQCLRSVTSVGAHYREAARARSKAEFISKLAVGLQELDETIYWFELLIESGIVKENKLAELLDESHQLTAIFISSINTAKSHS